MRNENLEARLRRDAPAWREAVAAGAASRGGTAARTHRGARPFAALLAAAAAIALAGLLWLPGESPRVEPMTPTRPPTLAAATPLLPADLFAHWPPTLPVPAPPLQLTDAEAALTDPLRRETDRLQQDIASAVRFVVDLVPGVPGVPGVPASS